MVDSIKPGNWLKVKQLKIMKTTVRNHSESKTIVSGKDRFGAKEDFFEVHEERQNGEHLYRVYRMGHAHEGPYQTFGTYVDALDAARLRIRQLKVLISERSNRPLELI